MEYEQDLIKRAIGEKWELLSKRMQARFEEESLSDAPKKYKGEMLDIQCSFLGSVLANFMRPIGSPLLPYNEKNVPIDVKVYKNETEGIIFKERIYHFKNRRPFKVLSWMVVNTEGQIQEFIGFGLGMRMALDVRQETLFFKGAGYFLKLGRFNIPIPLFLSPGEVLVEHSDHGDAAFRVRIEMKHPWFGQMYLQDGIFKE